MALLPMNMDILPPCDDRVFKLILTSPNAKPALLDLIPAIIGRPVVDVLVRNNELPAGDTKEKIVNKVIESKILACEQFLPQNKTENAR